MNVKRAAVVPVSALALLFGGAGVTHAGDVYYYDQSEFLSCLNVEVLDVNVLSTESDEIDCRDTINVHNHYETTSEESEKDENQAGAED